MVSREIGIADLAFGVHDPGESLWWQAGLSLNPLQCWHPAPDSIFLGRATRFDIGSLVEDPLLEGTNPRLVPGAR
jgi:hypothetical protein